MNYTFSGFSKAGNAVVRGAIAAAQDMGHTYVGTEHLLLALARDDTGEAAAFLLERQVYGYQVGRLLREQVGCGRRTRLSPRDFTPALSKCVDCAVIEAKAVSDGKVEPVHLLAALLEAPATAGRILVQLGVEPAAAAKECGRRMGKFPLFQQTPRPVTSPRGAARAAEKYGKDLTSLAEQDKLDPVLGRDSADEESLAELAALVETAGAESVGMILQSREKPDPHSFIGEGKVDEIRELV